MRLVTYRQGDSAAESVGVVEEETVYGFRPGLGMVELLSRGNEVLLAEAERARSSPSEVLSLNEVVLRAPVPVPPSIRDFLAFEQHIRNARGDVDPDWYELPVFYFSNPAAVHGPFDDVAVSPGSEMFDFELEVAAVIGTEGGDLTPSDAELHIAGYTVLCDFSARDLQQREMRQHLGPAKGKDGATSLGPWLVTADELEPFRSGRAFALEMSAQVNGRLYGGGRLDSIYWSFGEMIAYASRGTRVMPGDVFGSGTVGTGCILERVTTGLGDQYPWLEPGDVVELTVEHLGTVRHRITPAADVHELRTPKA